VLRYDTHGHGQTTKRGKVTLAQLGEDVISLLDHLNIAKAHFCGISMGGLTGIWLARFAPERFSSITVANTAAKIGEQSAWLSRARTVREEGMDVVAAVQQTAGLPAPSVNMNRKRLSNWCINSPARKPKATLNAVKRWLLPICAGKWLKFACRC
jgi:3-oxoadipate enol-lactonase (EC 3.1.1.24)